MITATTLIYSTLLWKVIKQQKYKNTREENEEVFLLSFIRTKDIIVFLLSVKLMTILILVVYRLYVRTSKLATHCEMYHPNTK